MSNKLRYLTLFLIPLIFSGCDFRAETEETKESDTLISQTVENTCPINDVEVYKDNKGQDVFSYAVNKSCEEVAIIASESSDYIPDLVIPDKIKNIPVTAVLDYAFEGSRFETIKLPNNLKYIGQYAFSDNKIKNIEIPKTVFIIDDFAFDLNTYLTGDLIIPDNTLYVGKFAFSTADFKSITLGKNINFIGDSAFSYSDSLIALKYHPDYQTYIGVGALPDHLFIASNADYDTYAFDTTMRDYYNNKSNYKIKFID